MKKFRQLLHFRHTDLGLVERQERLCHGSCDSCIIRFKCYTEPKNGCIVVSKDEFVNCGDVNEFIYYG